MWGTSRKIYTESIPVTNCWPLIPKQQQYFRVIGPWAYLQGMVPILDYFWKIHPIVGHIISRPGVPELYMQRKLAEHMQPSKQGACAT